MVNPPPWEKRSMSGKSSEGLCGCFLSWSHTLQRSYLIPDGDTSHRSADIMIKERDEVKNSRRLGSLCLSVILPGPEAEPSWALSCDRSVITARWINTCVVKVKWCYVVRGYWTWHVTLHDTDTFSALPLVSAPRLRLRLSPAEIPRRRSSVEASAPTDQSFVLAGAQTS